jgi:predicted lipoprotein with Yx(FWY)xxD motif
MEAPAASEALINVATDPKLGQILVDGSGMTLYIYTKDSPDTSTCTGGCAKAWPPLLSGGSPKAGSGVDQTKLGTAKLADGSLIVTYNHLPLYHWASDAKAGDTTGQGVGGVWYVIGPNGTPIAAAVSTPNY